MKVPEELAALASERRVIPFVGAGFSVALGLPDWETMLRRVAEDMEEVPPFDEIFKYANGDLLQIAEYLYLRSDRQIGPIRHFLERGLSSPADPLSSGSHVELANLHAPQIYTTNYDDMIERTFKALALPVAPVVLPRDVAFTDDKKTQVVKYHGDLRHESTLVLTESSYYRRLDFESPMDLKFRSDLLGRSVLFMGYSFRDINIRVIWFKLLEMMKDVPEADRTPSYIVRTQANPVLEELYRSVGLRTIVLTDRDDELTTEEISDLHGEFLMRLADASQSPDENPRKFWISSARLDRLEGLVREAEERFQNYQTVGGRLRWGGMFAMPGRRILSPDRVPSTLMERAGDLYRRLLASNTVGGQDWQLALRILRKFGPSTEVTDFFALALSASNRPEFRESLVRSDLPWKDIWSGELSADALVEVARRLGDEVEYCSGEQVDEDLAFVVDVAKRILSGEIATAATDNDVASHLSDLLRRASGLFPEVDEYLPVAGERPQPEQLLSAIRASPKYRNDGPSGRIRLSKSKGLSAG